MIRMPPVLTAYLYQACLNTDMSKVYSMLIHSRHFTPLGWNIPFSDYVLYVSALYLIAPKAKLPK